MMDISKLQERLCNKLQEGLPVCSRPFGEIAKAVGSDEDTVLEQSRELKAAGIIRRICALINYRALGKTGTLVAAHIPSENLQEITEAVNSLVEVSHNYLRAHFYNLWFTLQAESQAEIEITLKKLSARFGIEFYSLPVERIFKLDVRFDAESDGRVLDEIDETQQVVKSETVELNEEQELILSKLQDELEITARPFGFLCSGGVKEVDALAIVRSLVDKGVISRIRAVVDHRKLGFAANVLFVCKVSEERVVEAGEALARFGAVSHCYERKTFEGWPYNLFAMMHGKSMGDVQRLIDKFVEGENIEVFELLPTAVELKKQPVRHKFL